MLLLSCALLCRIRRRRRTGVLTVSVVATTVVVHGHYTVMRRTIAILLFARRVHGKYRNTLPNDGRDVRNPRVMYWTGCDTVRELGGVKRDVFEFFLQFSRRRFRLPDTRPRLGPTSSSVPYDDVHAFL